jgi:hypothetical protein
MSEEKKLDPGDIGYPGGESWATVRVNGKAKKVRIRKDANGNVTYVGMTDKIFGIF